MRQRRNGTIRVMICILGFLGVFPGLDILAFMLLHPSGFWQRIVFVGIAAMLMWPMIIFAAFVETILTAALLD